MALGVVLLSICATLLLCFGACAFLTWRQRRKRKGGGGRSSGSSGEEGTALAPASSRPDVFVKQPAICPDSAITFVLPTVSVGDSVNTEDEANSEADTSSVSSATKGSSVRIGSLRSRYALHPEDLDKYLYLSDEATVVDVGKIGFTLRYSVAKQELEVLVIGCTNLPAKFQKGSADPFVKVLLLPDKHPKFCTKIKKNSLNPVFDETFRFHVKQSAIEEKVLKFVVSDYDRFSRRVAIGYAWCPLTEAGFHIGLPSDMSTSEIWKDLTDRKGSCCYSSHRGEICISLCYMQDMGQLTLTVVKANDLGDADQDIGSVYCKVTLYEGKKVIKSKKTVVQRKKKDPVFDEDFTIQVPRSYLINIHCSINVYTKSRIGVRKLLGRVDVGPSSYVMGSGLDHWNDMMNSSGTTVVRWHKLM